MPTIIVVNNKFKFQCTTPNANFTSTLSTAEEQFTGDEVVMDSDVTTYILTICLSRSMSLIRSLIHNLLVFICSS